jgi:hypothetical protein
MIGSRDQVMAHLTRPQFGRRGPPHNRGKEPLRYRYVPMELANEIVGIYRTIDI